MSELKNNFVLHAEGSYQKNTSYFEDANGSGYIDRTYKLEEGSTINPFGHEIEIKSVNENSVDLIINDQRVTLKENDRYIVAYKNETSGRNEDFRIDREELYISLVNEKKHFYPHLVDFIDNEDKIENNIKVVENLVKNKTTYYEIQNYLKVILNRINDKEKFEKDTENKVDFIIEEIKIALPFKSVIEELINDIDVYFKEHNKLIDAIIKRNKLDSEEYKYLSNYLYQLAIEHSSYDHIPFNKIMNLLSLVGNRHIEIFRIEINLKEEEIIEILWLLMKIHAKSRFYFEYFYVVNQLAESLLKVDENHFNYNKLVNINMDIADYYVQIYNRPKAMTYYLNASEIAKKNNDLELSAYALMKYYKTNSSFPIEMKVSFDIEKIKQEYKGFSDIVISGINYKPLKVCEAELNPIFIDNYVFVMRKVEEEIDKVGDLHIPYQRWDLMQKIYLEKYNLDWKTPKQMNPRVMFD